MQNLNLIYRLDGQDEVIRKGISVFDLAPILLSVGDLIREANQTVGKTKRDIAVNVKPFREGSFIIDIAIFAKTNAQQIIDFVNQDEVANIKEVLEWIGIIGGVTLGTPVTLWKLVKFLKGKPKTVSRLAPNEVRYESVEGDSISVSNEVHALFQNVYIQQHFYNAYGKPLEKEGVETVDSFLAEEEENKVTLEKEDSTYLKNYSNTEIPTLDQEEIIESQMEFYLSPKRGSFDADPRQWSFYFGSDKQIITATIKDKEFLDKCASGVIKPHHNDMMKVLLLQKVKRRNGRIDPQSTFFEVEKVLSYEVGSSGEQLDLLD